MAHSEHLIESRPVTARGISDLPSNADTERGRGAVAARADPLIALLIVDDPADARRFARRLTRAARASRAGPVRLVHVDTVAAACEMLGPSTVDVIMLELQTSDARVLDGLHQVCAAAGGLPVIALAADEAVASDALRAGPWDCVCKPPDGASLRRILCRARDRHHLVQELDVARRALAARDCAVGIVSHDLRNSLGSIHICAAALLDPSPPSMSGTRQMAQIILRATAWMQRIVQDLLDHASLDAGRLALDRKPTVVADVMGTAHVMFAPVAGERALELVVESATDLPLVDADPHRLLQVLLNLLGNAMKFTPAGGRVVLSARTADEAAGDAGAVCFTVSDTGPGIPPEDLPHVCDWFWQAEHRRRGGAGLGLAIAKGLIEAHGGRLHVESVPGHGSTFWFTVSRERCHRPPQTATCTRGATSCPAPS